MGWILRTVRPYAHQVARRRARYDPRQRGREWPERRFETLKGSDPQTLRTHPVWQVAPLTAEAREAFALCDVEFWGVRHPGIERPFALVVRPCRYRHERGFRGDIAVSEAPEFVFMSRYDSTLVVTRDLVFCCGGATSVEGLRFLCHALDDTHIGGDPDLDFRRRPRRPLDIPAEDEASLGMLSPRG